MKKIALLIVFFCLCITLFANVSSKMIEEWQMLSEDEKWFCLLSEPLMEQNSLSITTVNPERYVPIGSKSASQSILENSWELFSREDVLNIIESYRLKQLGHAKTYNELKEKLNQTSKKSLEQLIIKECMETPLIARLYYVADMQKTLGEYGLLAWDNGRMLSVLRWSIAAGWLSETEALNLAKPFIDEILNSYDSWEDYAVHYAFGRVFYALSIGKDYQEYLDKVLRCIKKYDIKVSENEKDKVFTYNNTKFPAKNQNNNRILKYADAVYKPSKDATPWILAVRMGYFGENYVTSSEYSIVTNFLERKIKIPAAGFLRAVMFYEKETAKLNEILNTYNGKNITDKDQAKINKLYTTSFKKILNYFDEANPAFENTENKNDLYYNFYIYYAATAYFANDVKKMSTTISMLDEEKCQTSGSQNLYSIYYGYKAKEYATFGVYKKAIEYTKKALSCIEKGRNLSGWSVISEENMYSREKTLKQMLRDYESLLKQEEYDRKSINNNKA
ncbi:MAG: DUF1266 domain-containing protein [Treponema sp.]|nr:DUF1266 domain-containing protein [Treponema sp.]